MRILHSFATICLFGAGLAAALPACSSDPASSGDPVARGAEVWADQGCDTCHGSDAKGREGPNITMSTTAGIGAWSYQQFHDAVRLAKGKDGVALCQFMTKFEESDISEAGMQDLHAYIKSLPISDVVNRGSYCP